MPQRRYIVLIGLAWLAVTGWVVQREIWPMLRSGQPPPFTIDLIDETTHGSNAEIIWLGVKNNQVHYTIKTSAEYRKQDNTFNMIGYVGTKNMGPNREDQMVHHKVNGEDKTEQELYMDTSQFVTREGELRAVWAKIAYFSQIKADLHAKIDLELQRATVVEGRFTPHWIGTITFYRPDGEIPQHVDLVGEEVYLPPRASMHNPLLPVNRLMGIQPGQRWRVRVVDPLKDALASAMPFGFPGLGLELRFHDASVLEETREMEWKSRPVACHVVEFREGDQVVGRTWARVSDGLVLRQESYLDNDHNNHKDHWDIIRQTN